MGRERRRRPLRLRPPRSDDGVADDAGELHDHAAAVASRSTRRRSSRRATTIGFKQLVDGRAARYEDRYAPIAYAGNPDFNYRSFRTTNVLRWEYKPGSALFVVWQQGREDVLDPGRFQFGRDFGGVFGAPARNVFLVKWSYWINQ